MAEQLLKKLSSLNYKIITIESMTGGGIINKLTNIPGYSDTIYGGLTVYHNNAKTELLSVITSSVYTLDYAKKMCTDALSYYSVETALSITGNTNPTDPVNNDYSSVFYIAFAFMDNDKINITAQQIILDNDTLINHKNNDTTRRKFIKKIAIKKSIEFALNSLNTFF